MEDDSMQITVITPPSIHHVGDVRCHFLNRVDGTLTLHTRSKTTREAILRSLDHYYLIRKHLNACVAAFDLYPEAVPITRPDAATRRLPTYAPLEAAQNSLATHHSGIVECLKRVNVAPSHWFGLPNEEWNKFRTVRNYFTHEYPTVIGWTESENFTTFVPGKKILYEWMLNHVQSNIVLCEQQLANYVMWTSLPVYERVQQSGARLQVQQFGNGSDQFLQPAEEIPTPLSPVRKLITCILGFNISLLACVLGVFSLILLVPLSLLFECFNGFPRFGFHLFDRYFTPFWTFCCRSKFIASWSRNIGNWFQRIGDGPEFFVDAQQAEEGRAGGGNHDSSRYSGPDEANGDRRVNTGTQPATIGQSNPADIRATNNADDPYTEIDHAAGADEATDSIPLRSLVSRRDAVVEIYATSEPSSPDIHGGAAQPTGFVQRASSQALH